MKTYQIHFIRHGSTSANLNGQYIGSTDVPLSETGIEDIKNLKSKLNYPNVGKVYTSPLTRCIQTAGLIYDCMESTVVPGLAECNFGEWEGKSAEDLKNNENFLLWLNGHDDALPENGESLKNFKERICASFENLVIEIVKKGIKDTAIITHGGVIMTLLAEYGLPKANFYDWIVGNGCGYSVRITPSLWMRDKIMEVYSKVPQNLSQEENEKNTQYIINLVRQAANTAYQENFENI